MFYQFSNNRKHSGSSIQCSTKSHRRYISAPGPFQTHPGNVSPVVCTNPVQCIAGTTNGHCGDGSFSEVCLPAVRLHSPAYAPCNNEKAHGQRGYEGK